MINVPLIIIILLVFALIITSYSFHDKDYVAISLLGCFFVATIAGLVYDLTLDIFIGYINFEAIIVIISMIVITKIAQDSKILEFLAIKMYSVSRGNKRIFFYLICLMTTFFSAIINGIIVVIVLVPIVVRLCSYLKIKSGTFLIGMTLCVNIGSILTPWKNIIISSHFNLDSLFYIQYIWLFTMGLFISTVVIIDLFWLSKEPKIEEIQKKLVLELVSNDVIIENRKMFFINSVALVLIVVLFILLPFLYLTAIFAAVLLVLINRKLSKRHMNDFIKEIDWGFIIFFTTSYIIVGCLLQAGFKEIIDLILFESLPLVLILVLLVGAVTLVISFLPDTPTALIFIPIVEILISDNGISSVLILSVFLIVFNIGGNFLPQGSSCDMLTLQIAEDHKVDNINFRRLLIIGSLITTFHLIITVLYGLVLGLF